MRYNIHYKQSHFFLYILNYIVTFCLQDFLSMEIPVELDDDHYFISSSLFWSQCSALLFMF